MAQDPAQPTASHAADPAARGTPGAPALRPAVDIIAPAALPAADRLWLAERTAEAGAYLAPRSGGEVRIRIIADAAMAEAHERYSGVPGTTDVLTFDLAEGMAAQGEPFDVDILLCIDEASRQAAARGHAVRDELLLYAVHALLHCLGENDHDEHDAARMHAREDRTLSALGLGPVYAREPRA
ncbi:MAG: rRNA maturation RNase YbeY [Phycisphaerales bacterium]|jgi:probable rRNA maturation factor|nr:rRNA maturation RNase YbeY [Phycisphaeraceae bacterium]